MWNEVEKTSFLVYKICIDRFIYQCSEHRFCVAPKTDNIRWKGFCTPITPARKVERKWKFMQEKIVDIHIRVSENEKKKLQQKAKKRKLNNVLKEESVVDAFFCCLFAFFCQKDVEFAWYFFAGGGYTEIEGIYFYFIKIKPLI